MSRPDRLFETLRTYAEEDVNSDIQEKMIWDAFGRTCAVLVMDSTGFSRTTQKKGIVYFLSIIAKMREVGRSIFKDNGAVGFRCEADNLYGEFPSAEQALAAAFALHRYFRENPLPLYDEEIYGVCIGIGYGKLLASEHEGMYGDEMNLASKLGEDTADGGETLLTEAAYLALENREEIAAHRRLVKVSGVDLPYFDVKPVE